MGEDYAEVWNFARQREADRRMREDTLAHWERPGRLARLARWIRQLIKGE